MIVQCPSCNARFSIDASKINSSLSKGRCSLCGHVFPVLDHAVDQLEATEIRDRLEEERARRAKETVGDVTGMYGVTVGKGVEEESSQGALGEESLLSQTEVSFEEGETIDWTDNEEVEAIKEMAEEDEKIALRESETYAWEEETEQVEKIETVIDEEGTEREEGIEETPEVEKYEFVGIEGEEKVLEELSTEAEESKLEKDFEFETTAETEEIAEWPPPGEIMEGEFKESQKEEATFEGKEEGVPEEEIKTEPEELKDAAMTGKESMVFEKEKRSSIPVVPLVVLIVLILAVGGWYFFRSEASSLITKVTEKISSIRGQSALIIFDLKNEQEPASDGKFFAVRGFIQNKQKTSFPYVTLRIKIYDAKNKVILTKQTLAGRVLKADELSKMTVQDVLKQLKAMNEMNRKSSGKLGPNQKLAFLFLFDLSKFPRKTAKTFQVEILKPPKK